jgi:hypothetical protein
MEPTAFTSPAKGGVLRIFFALKIRRLRWGLNPRTWVPKASTLPLDHRSRYCNSNNKLAGCLPHLVCSTSLKMAPGCRNIHEVLYALYIFYNEVHLLEDILISETVTIFQKSFHGHNPGSRQMNKKFFSFSLHFLTLR